MKKIILLIVFLISSSVIASEDASKIIIQKNEAKPSEQLIAKFIAYSALAKNINQQGTFKVDEEVGVASAKAIAGKIARAEYSAALINLSTYLFLKNHGKIDKEQIFALIPKATPVFVKRVNQSIDNRVQIFLPKKLEGGIEYAMLFKKREFIDSKQISYIADFSSRKEHFLRSGNGSIIALKSSELKSLPVNTYEMIKVSSDFPWSDILIVSDQFRKSVNISNLTNTEKLKEEFHIQTDSASGKILSQINKLQADPLRISAELELAEQNFKTANLNFKENVKTVQDELNQDYFKVNPAIKSIIFKGTAAWAFFYHHINAYLFQKLIKETGAEADFVFSGESGGAISALLLSLNSGVEKITAHQLSKGLDGYDQVLDPNIAYEIGSFLIDYKHWFLGLFALLLILALSWHKSFHWTLLVYAALSCYLIFPKIEGTFLTAILALLILSSLLGLSILRENSLTKKIFFFLLISFFFSVCKWPLDNSAIFKTVNYEGLIKRIVGLSPTPKKSLAACIKRNPSKEKLSECLYEEIEFPLVITAVELAPSLRTLRFYIKPKDSSVVFPKHSSWVNIRNCKEKLIDILEASSSLPIFFNPRNIRCGNLNIKLTDNVSNGLPLEAAIAVGATKHFFDNDDIMKFSAFGDQQASRIEINGNWSSILDFIKIFPALSFKVNTVDKLELTEGHTLYFTNISEARIPFTQENIFGTSGVDGKKIHMRDLAKYADRELRKTELTFTKYKNVSKSEGFFSKYENRIESFIKENQIKRSVLPELDDF